MIDPNPAVDDYLGKLTEDRRQPMNQLRDVIVNNIPAGFEEQMTGTPNYVVPLPLFPSGYHCTPNTPLPYMGIASQKNFIALHHFGMYVDKELLTWFCEEYPRHMKTKLDMGKSCVRFKKPDQIPLELIAELVSRRTPEQWIACYKAQRSR